MPMSLETITNAVLQSGTSVVDGKRGSVIVTADVVTTSRLVAQVFGKRHHHVLRAIYQLECFADGAETKNGLGSPPADVNQLKSEPADVQDAAVVYKPATTEPEAYDPWSDDAPSYATKRLPPAKNIDKELADFGQRNFALVDYVDANGQSRPMVEMTRKGFEFLTLAFTGRKAAQFRMAYINRFHEMEQTIARRAAEAAITAERYPELINVFVDYGWDSYVTLRQSNPKHVPLPNGVTAMYDADFADMLRKHSRLP